MRVVVFKYGRKNAKIFASRYLHAANTHRRIQSSSVTVQHQVNNM